MSIFELSDRSIDLVEGVVRLHGQDWVTHKLTSRELALVDHLARQPEGAATRDELLVEVWGHAPDSLSRAVDLAVRRLRKKLEPDPGGHPRHLLTVYGTGYRLVGSGAQASRPPRPDGPRRLPLSHDAALDQLTAADPSGRLAAAPQVCAQLLEEADRMPDLLVVLGELAAWSEPDRLLEDVARLLAASPPAEGARDDLARLPSEAARLARVLSAFAGPVPLEAVEAVVGAPCLPALSELRTAGLLVPFADGVRLRAPHRQVLQMQQDSDQPAGFALRRIAWAGSRGTELAARIERWGRTSDWAGLESLAPELRACLTLAERVGADATPLWLAVGALPVHHPLASPEEPVPADPRVAIVRGRWARLRAPLSEVKARLQAACEVLSPGDLYRRAGELALARVCMDGREWTAALSLLDPLAVAEPPDAISGEACLLRCRVLLRLADAPGARRALLEGMDILDGVGAARLLGTAWGIRADLYESEGRLAESRRCMQTALELHCASGNARGEAVTRTNLVNLLADLGDYDDVWPMAEAARAAHRRQGARRSEGILLANLTGIAAAAEEVDRAEAWGAQAVRICHALDLAGFEVQAWLNLATVSLGAGAAAEAGARVQQARRCAEPLHSAQLDTLVAAMQGAVAAAEDDLDGARVCFEAVDPEVVSTASPGLAACLDLMHGLVDVCAARTRGTEDATPHLAGAQARIDALHDGDQLRPQVDSTEVRGTLRLLRRAIAQAT